MRAYAILTPIKRGGTVHRGSIRLSDAEAAPLLASGAIEARETTSVGGRERPTADSPGQMTAARARVSDTNKKPRRRKPAKAV